MGYPDSKCTVHMAYTDNLDILHILNYLKVLLTLTVLEYILNEIFTYYEPKETEGYTTWNFSIWEL